MSSIESRLLEEEAAICELEARVAQQASVLRQTPSAAGQASMKALERSLELGRRHLQFEQHKLKAETPARSDVPAIPAPVQTAAARDRDGDGEDAGDEAGFLLEAERHAATSAARTARQEALVRRLSEQGRERDAAEARMRLLNLRRILGLARERLRLEQEAAAATAPPMRDGTPASPMRLPALQDARVIDIVDVDLAAELDAADREGEVSELERTSLAFAQEEQRKGRDPDEILRRLKGEYYPLHLYNSDIEQAGYSFGLRLPRERYLLYRAQLSEWSVAQERPEWL